MNALAMHEQVHIDDLISAYGKNICKGKPEGLVVTFNTACEVYKSEVNATIEEINCIKSKLNKLKGSNSCKILGDVGLRTAEEQRQQNIDSMIENNCNN